MSIGEQIRNARNCMNMNQEDLAMLIHVSRGKVSHWETGLREPNSADIKELETVLQCKFEIEQEQVQLPEDQAAEAPASTDDSATVTAKNKIADVFRKKVPVWLCAASAGGIFAVMLIIMICTVANLNGQLRTYQMQLNANQNQPVAENTLEWYQQTVRPQDGKAYVTVEIDPNPVKGVRDPNGGDEYMWFYTIAFIEHNGIPFDVEEIFFQSFNGTTKIGAQSYGADILNEAWGSTIIPAHGQQIFTGGLPILSYTIILFLYCLAVAPALVVNCGVCGATSFFRRTVRKHNGLVRLAVWFLLERFAGLHRSHSSFPLSGQDTLCRSSV